MAVEKIKKVDELEKTVEELRKIGKKIVQCHGCFDIVHPGHLEHFKDARNQGDVLIVTVTKDEFVDKGPGRPFHNQDSRVKFLSELECIDYVALNNEKTAMEVLGRIKPDVYVKGKEVLNNSGVDAQNSDNGKTSNLKLEEQIVNSYGGKLYLTDMPTSSSSSIANRISSSIPEETKSMVEGIRINYTDEQLASKIDSLKDLKVLIIGDAILDEFTFCEIMEKSGKTDLITTKYKQSETQLGGIFAIANHLADFVNNVKLITVVGSNDLGRIFEGVDKRVDNSSFIQYGEKTIVKKRYVDKYTGKKMFEIYNTEELQTSSENEEKIKKTIDQASSEFDLIIVADFGHGMITQGIIDQLSKFTGCLSINCQLNGGNMGYNFITKYNRADFVSLNDKEIRLPLQIKDPTKTESAIVELSKRLQGSRINTTLGKKGMVYYDTNNFHRFPSFTLEPLDTIGSGDAVFCLTSLLVCKGIEPELIPFFGNCMGALSTRIFANRRNIDSTELNRFVKYVVK
ncbi:hypothetical protein CMI42_02050 [Candidatus Pacearchaeota archaeon]|nr:hypothetical protein [Candidatus Pacearchaeota archaeon]